MVACDDDTVRVWSLTGEKRSFEDLIRLAGLLVGRQIDKSGGLTPMAPEELKGTHQLLRAIFPELLTPGRLAMGLSMNRGSQKPARFWSAPVLWRFGSTVSPGW